MKSSTMGGWVILLRSMYILGTHRCTLALIICGFSSSFPESAKLGFRCTTTGEHHVMGSCSGPFSNMSPFIP